MQIVILSYRRPHPHQHSTYHHLVKAGVPVTMVVRQEEVDAYAKWVPRENIWALPATVTGVATTRDAILYDMGTDVPVCMLDDDLDFAVRRDDDRTKFRAAEPEDIRAMFQAIQNMLKKFPFVSMAPREGGNRRTEPLIYNSRVMRVLAYDRKFMREHAITFTPAEFMADFHVALQLLRMGQDYVLLNNYVNNQHGGSGAPGGCSETRTPTLQDAEARKLAALHPGFVKVTQKTTEVGWGGGTRTDVTVAWKQARKSAT